MEHILDVQSLLGSSCPMVRHCQRQTVLPVILHSTLNLSDTCRVRRREMLALASCIHEQYIFRMPCPAMHVSAHGVAESSTATRGCVNVTSPKSLTSACTITPGLWHTATTKPCEVDADWICHQHVAPLSIEARSRSQASDPGPSTHTTP